MSHAPEQPDDYWTKTTSADGAYVWIVKAWEARMSLWVMAGALHQTSPRTLLFEPPEEWSFEERAWTSKSELRLVGRRYPGGLPGIVLTLDVPGRRGTIALHEPDALPDAQGGKAKAPAPPSGSQPFDLLLHWLEAYAPR